MNGSIKQKIPQKYFGDDLEKSKNSVSRNATC